MIRFTSPENKLWWMVISQTLFDLQSATTRAGNPVKTKYSLYESCTLRDVLIDIHNPWMQEICRNADLDYMKFLDIVEKIVHKKISIGQFTDGRGRFNKTF